MKGRPSQRASDTATREAMKPLPVLSLGLGHTDKPTYVEFAQETVGLACTDGELEDLFLQGRADQGAVVMTSP